jgi:hypothetical protein
MGTIEGQGGFEAVVEKSQSEGENGHSDIRYRKRELYDYTTSAHTPPDAARPTGNIFDAPDYDYDPETRTYRLGWNYVAPASLDGLIAKARNLLGGNPRIDTKYDERGWFALRVTGRCKEPNHVEEWLVASDWFKHETREEWLGVTVEHDPATGAPTGFYKEYEKNADGSYAQDSSGNLIPVGAITPFREIRGDLDANWMGSDPQHPSSGTGAPLIYVSTGKNDDKQALSPEPEHQDYHDNGWTGDNDWTDPDNSTTGPMDKVRSHVLTRVEPRRNDDGTYDVSIHRVYPHQRYWAWETEQGSSSGDTRTAKHFAYRNWPSRRSIKKDILEKIQDQIEGDWEDGWTLTGNISVNEFGLVDAPNLTLAPSWANDDHLLAKGGTDYTIMVIPTLEKSYTAPAQYATNLQPPADGYWWRIVTKTVVTGTTWIESRAIDAMQNACEGSRGVEFVPSNGHQMRHWKWHCVTNISPGAWQNRSLTANDLNTGSIKHHVGDYPPTTP